MNMYAYRTYKRSRNIASSKIGIEDLKRICQECILVNGSARAEELRYHEENYQIFEKDSDDEKERKSQALEKEKGLINNHSLVVVTIEGGSGEHFTILPGADLDIVFSHVNVPHKVTKIKIDNWSNFQVFTDRLPFFRFTVVLDFVDAPIWVFQNPDFPNQSNVEAMGLNEIWALGVVEKLGKAIERRRSTIANFVHKYLRYGFLMWAVGMPGVILGINLLASSSLIRPAPGVEAVAFLALGLFGLTLFRAFFNYVRWLFPYLELDEQPKRLQTLQRSIAVFFALGILSGWLGLIAEAIWN